MKSLLAILLLTFAASASAQTVSNFTLRTTLTFTSGTIITNTITVGTNNFPAIQYAIDTWNAVRTNASPAKSALTNYSQFLIESAKDRVAQATNDYDLYLSKTLLERVSVMSEADKATIRQILSQY